MSQIVESWASALDGQYIDMDGYGDPTAQCHDIWLSYLVSVAGGQQFQGYAPSGFTDSVFTSFPVNGVDSVVTKHYGTAGIRAGDVVFWGYGSQYYPYSHVAVALAEPVGGYVACLTQNPGVAHRESLILAGALGYLRPIRDISDSGVTPEPIDKDKPVEYISGSRNNGTQVVSGGNKPWIYLNDSNHTSFAVGAGDFQITTTVDLHGTAGTRVALTAYRVKYVNGSDVEEVFLEEIDVTLQPNGRARRQLVIPHRLPSSEWRTRVRITVPQGASPVTVGRFSWKGHKWNL
ncbi:hypothetical protein EDF60_2862 [Leucobacter luti]|uniref:hypothetical protein n=1 Tax=Leucobacter luti TaxID=340320 RepID=UPI0010477F76|nr:hypothetical protein [Leucobacter luti]MCW2289116.1 hypothetical protein [Leucobacter luti]TCK35487.1 hypothetical protein EDF60_2862 [Leucobacter luti]